MRQCGASRAKYYKCLHLSQGQNLKSSIKSKVEVFNSPLVWLTMAHIPVWELSVWVFAGVWALNGLYEVMSGGCWLGGLRYQLSTHSNHSPHVMAAITTHSSNALNTSFLREHSSEHFPRACKEYCWVIMSLIKLDKIVWSHNLLISLWRLVSAVTFLTMLCSDNEASFILHLPQMEIWCDDFLHLCKFYGDFTARNIRNIWQTITLHFPGHSVLFL